MSEQQGTSLAKLRYQKTLGPNLQNALQIGLITAGLAAAARGGLGAAGLVGRNTKPSARTPASSPIFIDIPTKAPKPEEEEADYFGYKAASEGDFFYGTVLGGNNTDPKKYWGRLPLAVGGGLAGAYGGWNLADALMDRRRKTEVKTELEEAKRKYEEALRGRSKLGQALDALCDQFEKQAEGNWADFWGPAAGLAALTMLGSAAATGSITYNAFKDRDTEAIKEKAKKKLRQEQYQRRPSPIFARPVPMNPSTDIIPKTEETDVEESPLDKVASLQSLFQKLADQPQNPQIPRIKVPEPKRPASPKTR